VEEQKARGMRSKPAPPGAPGPAGAALPPVPPARGPVAWGSLAILERTGEDDFGEVFRARDPALGREVTLRLRRPSPEGDAREARFLEEARRLARVRNSSVLAILGADRRDGRLGVWTERIAGITLEERLEREGPLPPVEARRIGLELCRALTAIHFAGIVHREISTTNVVQSEAGRIVLLDSGSLGGLPPARGPGRRAGERASPGTDIHALGVLLYRVVTGRDPFEAAIGTEAIERDSRRELVRRREHLAVLPLDLVRVIERAIDPDPARGFATAPELERALAATLATPADGPAREREPAPAWLARLDRWRRAVSIVAALALGCTIAALLLAESERGAESARGRSPARGAEPAATGPAAAPARPAPASPPPEHEPAWLYQPVPQRDPTVPPPPREFEGPPAPAGSSTGAVAEATALLRAMAHGPPAPGATPASLTLSTIPDHAVVLIDGERQPALTPATYRLAPGPHRVRVEKPGFFPQEIAPLDAGPGQSLNASLTLARSPGDSL